MRRTRCDNARRGNQQKVVLKAVPVNKYASLVGRTTDMVQKERKIKVETKYTYAYAVLAPIGDMELYCLSFNTEEAKEKERKETMKRTTCTNYTGNRFMRCADRTMSI